MVVVYWRTYNRFLTSPNYLFGIFHNHLILKWQTIYKSHSLRAFASALRGCFLEIDSTRLTVGSIITNVDKLRELIQ